jgi:hypothetical protein
LITLVPSAMAENKMARCEMDLSPGRTQVPLIARPGMTVTFMHPPDPCIFTRDALIFKIK